MEDYEVIEHIKEKSAQQGKFRVVALNYKGPSYAKIESNQDVNVGILLQVDSQSNKVFLNKQEIGVLTSLRTGKDVKIDTNHDIKYTGGYSIDGKKVYLDEHFPQTLEIDGKSVDTRESIGRRHELVEKWLVDDAYEYPYAHMIATKIEREYVESLLLMMMKLFPLLSNFFNSSFAPGRDLSHRYIVPSPSRMKNFFFDRKFFNSFSFDIDMLEWFCSI